MVQAMISIFLKKECIYIDTLLLLFFLFEYLFCQKNDGWEDYAFLDYVDLKFNITCL